MEHAGRSAPPRFDGLRVAASAVATAGLAAGLAAAFLHHSAHSRHVGPTSAALSDGFSVIAGACLGLALGGLATAMLVRGGFRLVSGVLAGTLGFFLGVVPYLLLTAPSDVSTGDDFGFLAFVAVPAVVLVTVGSAVGAALGSGLQRRG